MLIDSMLRLQPAPVASRLPPILSISASPQRGSLAFGPPQSRTGTGARARRVAAPDVRFLTVSLSGENTSTLVPVGGSGLSVCGRQAGGGSPRSSDSGAGCAPTDAVVRGAWRRASGRGERCGFRTARVLAGSGEGTAPGVLHSGRLRGRLRVGSGLWRERKRGRQWQGN